MPLILSITGRHNSGKTTLIIKLLPELKKRGYRVGVAKHCPGGFDLDVEGKDSWRFTQAGGEGLFLSSEKAVALLRPRESAFDIKKGLSLFFDDFDIVLTEGYNEPVVKRFHLARTEADFEEADELVAYISALQVSSSKPILSPDDIPEIIKFIEGLL